MTTSTKIEYKHVFGFSGLLISLENYISFLAEKQGNMTSGMNHSYFNPADSAVGNDAYNHVEEIFLADSWNESNLSNCSLSLQSTPPDTKNYHLYLNTLTPVSPTTIIEKKEVGFSGLLVILENSVRNLAEKQANMTSGMNHSYFNLADSAVGNDAYNHDEEIFLADSRNESNF